MIDNLGFHTDNDLHGELAIINRQITALAGRLDIRWTGTDDTTPDGHVLALGIDNAGLLRLCLYAGDTPTDDQFRGSLLIPPDGHQESFLPTRTTAYNAGGGWVTCFGTQDSMLARLAHQPT